MIWCDRLGSRRTETKRACSSLRSPVVEGVPAEVAETQHATRQVDDGATPSRAQLLQQQGQVQCLAARQRRSGASQPMRTQRAVAAPVSNRRWIHPHGTNDTGKRCCLEAGSVPEMDRGACLP